MIYFNIYLLIGAPLVWFGIIRDNDMHQRLMLHNQPAHIILLGAVMFWMLWGVYAAMIVAVLVYVVCLETFDFIKRVVGVDDS